MNTPVEKIAATVLYEGYLLWPYRRSARKNQQRWTLGGIYPQAYSAEHPDDPWFMQTECLVQGIAPVVAVDVHFLQVVARQVMAKRDDGTFCAVDQLQVGAEQYLTWDEATERTIALEPLALPQLATEHTVPLAIAADCSAEPLRTADGTERGRLVRRWQRLAGNVVIQATAVAADLWRLTVRIANHTPWVAGDRADVVRQTFVSTHTILRVQAGAFVSLLDPPPGMEEAAAACQNIKTWPVLAGEEETHQIMLSSPMILYDYPQVAPESPGDLFDGGEIDQLLLLNILTLTDAEKAEMRASDPRARAILERSEALTTDDFMQLHGAIREFRTLNTMID